MDIHTAIDVTVYHLHFTTQACTVLHVQYITVHMLSLLYSRCRSDVRKVPFYCMRGADSDRSLLDVYCYSFH